MFILARGGQTYARLRYNLGPGADVMLPVEVDYSRPFNASDEDTWHDEYFANVQVAGPTSLNTVKSPSTNLEDLGASSWWRDEWDEYVGFDSNLQESEHGFIREY